MARASPLRKLSKESGRFDSSFKGEAVAIFLGKSRFGHYEFNGRGPMLWEAFVLSKNRDIGSYFTFCTHLNLISAYDNMAFIYMDTTTEFIVYYVLWSRSAHT